MTSRFFLLAAGAVFSLTAAAAPLTPSQALGRANAGIPARIGARIGKVAQPAFTARTANGTATSYLFNSQDGGYLLVSADDVAYPVLAYSETGEIDPSNMSPELQWWLDEYGRQIEWAVSKGAAPAVNGPAAPEGWTAIAPLVKTKWDQGAPYNNLCPTYNGTRCYTGCVATAMAQVMNYHKYPESGEGKVSYTSTTIQRPLSLDMSLLKLDWDNMIDNYSTQEYTNDQAIAVARLMMGCGYSVNMNYGTSASGAQGSSVGIALRTYFKYDKNLRDYMRAIYSSSEWTQMIYENLKNVGPLVMNGQSPAMGGHSFVCDGYSGDGYFHFNWGWSGMSDGYFALDALNPDAQGIGGAAGGFNFSQNAILGIQPPTGEPVITWPDRILQYGNTEVSLSGNTLLFTVSGYDPLGWTAGIDHQINVNIGAIIEPVEGTQGSTQNVAGRMGSMTVISLPGTGSYYPLSSVNGVYVNLPALADGKYKLTLASHETSDANAPWYPVLVPWGYNNYAFLTISNGVGTITNVPIDNLTISDVALGCDFYSGKNVLLKAKITNSTGIELSQAVTPVLMNGAGKIIYTGDGVMVSIAPGESQEKEWVSKFYDSNGKAATVTADTDFKLALLNHQTGVIYPGTEIDVTMKNITSSVTFQGRQGSILNAQTITLDFNERPLLTYVVEDVNDFTYQFSYACTRGFYDGQVTFNIGRPDPNNPTNVIPVKEQIYTGWPFILAPTEETKQVKISFPEAEDNTIYYIEGYYTLGSRQNFLLRTAFTKASSGVDGIDADQTDAEPEYYNLQGVRVAEPVKGEVVIERRGGKVTKRVVR